MVVRVVYSQPLGVRSLIQAIICREESEWWEIIGEEAVIGNNSRCQMHGVIRSQWMQFKQTIRLINDVSDGSDDFILVQTIRSIWSYPILAVRDNYL
jgi:hypothetical protein